VPQRARLRGAGRGGAHSCPIGDFHPN
jgi:hypothetical protein